ncbi:MULTISPECIES: hypothetical protein [unclassified Variovorax]|uniref:hypothetical protein n=1 Tax=unclassified Variovorax TaxID=663243 RepID=UPI00076BF195|nr:MULTISPECIES: hypothetical protein [unclassified Variovorax]KWT68539.1 hypothetical protein APY03_7046 [Variovorax sp. WDL1]PNG46659.1 hypothetical protein CHC06_07002 [Variovorax sp. B2]PNG48690.1 hypothetical protein CHC07_07866 [Variovorax sp. B4]VTV14444.1 hypothetical protein WDL1CHR_04975 [Variovorax sp. WDL1]
MFSFLPARWLAVLPALAACASGAQTGPAPDTAVAAEAATPLAYRSAMEGYKPFVDEKPVPWKEANETVRQRGGWQAYAKEGAAAAEGKPAGATDPHAGHAMPKPPAAPPKEGQP